ncbi:CU044_5270 family protein [Spirillospora sp. NPDC048911]|uniref:CU044_5270 family protein n=1 Tax=Spirillospora sp. NPDC048911 TaxID=3364527 RepID=UPI0037148CB8
MNSGATMPPTTDPDKIFQALRPAALDDDAEHAYHRRRDSDLARAMRADTVTDARDGVVPGRSRRRPVLLIAGVAAAACAAAGVIVVTDQGDGSSTKPPGREQAAPYSDARSVLLAAAQAAEREPAKPARYWYHRERTTSRAGDLMLRMDKSTGRPRKTKQKAQFLAYVSHTQEDWLARDKGDVTRAIVGIDRTTTFASPADEAKWKKMGSPELEPWSAKRHVNDYHEPMRLTIGQRTLTFAELSKLPTEAGALTAELRRRYEADVNDPKYPLQDSFPQYVWSTAQDLLAGPIKPGTRAAMFKVLAKQPGLRLVGGVTDEKGRRGVAVAMPPEGKQTHVSGDAITEYRLIVSPETGRLLSYEARRSAGRPSLTITYEAMGWVNALGARP